MKAREQWFGLSSTVPLRLLDFGSLFSLSTFDKKQKSTRRAHTRTRLQMASTDIRRTRTLRDRIRHFTPSWFALVMGPSSTSLFPVSHSFLRNRRSQCAHPEHPVRHTRCSVVGRLHILRPKRHPFLRLPRNVDCTIHPIPRGMEPNASSSSTKPVSCMLSDGFRYPHQRVSILVLR